MKMKLITIKKLFSFFIIFIILCFCFLYTNSSKLNMENTNKITNKNKFSLQNHFKMMTQFKLQSKMFLNNLFETANTHGNSLKEEEKELTNREEAFARANTNANTNTNTNTEFLSEIRRKFIKEKTVTHSSDLFQEHVNYKQFKYIKYEEIISKMKNLAKKYPNFLHIDTAQNLYGLPNPGGYCGKKKKK
jgi:hypothetical protein